MPETKAASSHNFSHLMTFLAITLFFFFESGQMSYFNVLAPYYLNHNIYNQSQVAGLSAAYYYGNVIGLLPVGFALDHFPLRKILLWAITGSVISALFLAITENYSIEWTTRFLCGFFGGTFAFVGGIRIILNVFPARFSFFMGLFIAAGMFGGLICQYPLLIVANSLGAKGAMSIMAGFGLFVAIMSLVYLRPVHHQKEIGQKTNQYPETITQMCFEILKKGQNWLDCLMIVLLDTPVSVMGTLWGVVALTHFYQFSDTISAFIIMALFAGLMLGSPLAGILGDRFKY